MGCDIHMYIERRICAGVGKWCMCEAVSFPNPAIRRDYVFFAALAGVRGEGPEPKGLPADASDSVGMFADDFASDGHSHSWESLKDFVNLHSFIHADEYKKVRSLNDKIKYLFPGVKAHCRLQLEDVDMFRVVFWFDN